MVINSPFQTPDSFPNGVARAQEKAPYSPRITADTENNSNPMVEFRDLPEMTAEMKELDFAMPEPTQSAYSGAEERGPAAVLVPFSPPFARSTPPDSSDRGHLAFFGIEFPPAPDTAVERVQPPSENHPPMISGVQEDYERSFKMLLLGIVIVVLALLAGALLLVKLLPRL